MLNVVHLEAALIRVASLATAAMVLDEPEERPLLDALIALIQKTANEATEAAE